jgi:hypothetical protein
MRVPARHPARAAKALDRAPRSRELLPEEELLNLNSTIGNAAFTELVVRGAAAGGATQAAAGGAAAGSELDWMDELAKKKRS